MHSEQPRGDLPAPASDGDLGWREKRKALIAACLEEHSTRVSVGSAPSLLSREGSASPARRQPCYVKSLGPEKTKPYPSNAISRLATLTGG